MWALPLQILIFCASLYVLLKSSDFFIEAAERIGKSFGIPSFIIGATIVALGTSLPELAASLAAVFQGETSVVAGNVIGSNITNILLVVGGVSLFIGSKAFNFKPSIYDLGTFIISAVLLYLFCLDGQIVRYEAFIFLACLLAYVISVVIQVRGQDEEKTPFNNWDLLLLILGGIGVALSARFNIMSIIKIGSILQIGAGYIALGAVALGTSLPEFFVSLSAAKKDNLGIAIGNILGSNIFNILAVVGISGTITSLDVPIYFQEFALPLMLLATGALITVILTKRTNRLIGGIFFTGYLFFIYQIFANNISL